MNDRLKPQARPTSIASAIYHGTIRHRRGTPAAEFTHPLSLAYVDLDELPSLLNGRLLRRGPGTLRFRRRDYLAPHSLALATAVRDRVERLTDTRPDGPIRMLSQLRSLGVCFNPVSFYYCLDGADGGLRTVLAEVTNTPWGERQCYALDESTPGSTDRLRDVRQAPACIAVSADGSGLPRPCLDAGLDAVGPHQKPPARDRGVRRDPEPAACRLTRAEVARTTARYPIAGARTLALIYGHALGLKLAGARYHPHTDPVPAPMSARELPVWRSLASSLLGAIRVGSLTIVEVGRRHTFGSGAPAATIELRDASFWRMLMRGSRGLAESYIRGDWDLAGSRRRDPAGRSQRLGDR